MMNFFLHIHTLVFMPNASTSSLWMSDHHKNYNYNAIITQTKILPKKKPNYWSTPCTHYWVTPFIILHEQKTKSSQKSNHKSYCYRKTPSPQNPKLSIHEDGRFWSQATFKQMLKLDPMTQSCFIDKTWCHSSPYFPFSSF